MACMCSKLTHFRQIFPFYTPWKHQKTKGYLMFSGGIKWEVWPEMGLYMKIIFISNFEHIIDYWDVFKNLHKVLIT